MLTPRFLRPLVERRSLMNGMVLGLATFVLLTISPLHWVLSTRVMVAWDVACLVFFWSIRGVMRCTQPSQIRRVAQRLDAGRNTVLGFCCFAAAIALGTVFFEMRLAKADHGWIQALRIGLVIATVALSWLFAQEMFALDYAHEFYMHDRDGRDRRGLRFPGEDQTPDYWDFFHFAITIGVAAQTADICIESRTMRRLVTFHALLSFAFNAVILALTINLTAGLV